MSTPRKSQTDAASRQYPDMTPNVVVPSSASTQAPSGVPEEAPPKSPGTEVEHGLKPCFYIDPCLARHAAFQETEAAWFKADQAQKGRRGNTPLRAVDRSYRKRHQYCGETLRNYGANQREKGPEYAPKCLCLADHPLPLTRSEIVDLSKSDFRCLRMHTNLVTPKIFKERGELSELSNL